MRSSPEPDEARKHQGCLRRPASAVGRGGPFVEGVGGDDAALPLDGAAEHRLDLDGLGFRVESPRADRRVLRPPRHEAPTECRESPDPGSGGDTVTASTVACGAIFQRGDEKLRGDLDLVHLEQAGDFLDRTAGDETTTHRLERYRHTGATRGRRPVAVPALSRRGRR